MKVAIIGAGKAGLSCAHELEQYGIKPVIYEKNGYIGELGPCYCKYGNNGNRPIKNPMLYLKNNFGIKIKPLNKLTKVVHKAPHKTTTIKGSLGYLYKSDRDEDSVKYQLYSQLKNTKVVFNQVGDYELLAKKYDHVVISTGNPNYTKQLGCWQELVNSYVRGATVIGEFDPRALIVWLDKEYCKNGYAYLTPFNDKKASLTLITTDVNEKEIDHYWEIFLDRANINYKIIEEYKLKHNLGIAYPKVYKNMIFAGASAGGLDPFLGFGLINAIDMGVAAARTIIKGWSYEKQIKDIIKRNFELKKFREAYNKLDNKDLDNLISVIGLPGIRHLTYYSPLNITQIGSLAIKLMEKIKSINEKK
ncbi:flavin-dependent dehydrogenase [Orenia metallireducens]|uniref:Dehydrogenase (Flavoprotein) n=1 Tax=Orenia metallireducens TaxID=1413210 RepID=A0A285FJE0_9FIRM|nr:FAD-dependent oxidoreductase [Orenia metallireducens]PRX33582.1 flavin-dependent dehydrogenase [Orenia metallireducens]SNY11335.1 Dehydrogenase (flavoprotein) [Orenia metallireducens]